MRNRIQNLLKVKIQEVSGSKTLGEVGAGSRSITIISDPQHGGSDSKLLGKLDPFLRTRDVLSRIRIRTFFHTGFGSRSEHFSSLSRILHKKIVEK
jgi:hypothetical protein